MLSATSIRRLIASLVLLSTWIALSEARAQTLLWKSGSSFGDLDRMGDFNGDGVGDIAIVDGISPVVLSGKDGSVLATYTQTGSATSTVAGIDDQDGDGVPDLLFSDPSYMTWRGNQVGRVMGISGASGSTFYSYTGWEQSWDSELWSGICVRGMGDGNGDGLPDFAFGIWMRPVFFGGPSIVMERWNGGATGVDVSLTWDFDIAFPVHELAPLGDVDGDGASDFAATYVDNTSGIGIVEVHSGKSGNLIRKINGAAKSQHFGLALGSCADLDGDGIRELMVGAPGQSVGSIAPGRVLIYSGATAVLLQTLDGEYDQQWFGYDVDGLDDVDGDGVDDFVVASGGVNGRNGRVQVFSGATGVELQRIEPESASRVRDVGDLDGDGHDDLAVASGGEVHAWKMAPYVAVDSVTPPRIRYDRVGALVVNGAGFTADPNLSVLIDGTPATNVVVYSYSVLSCDAPAGLLPGQHDVTVTNRFDSATLAGGLLLTPSIRITGDPKLGATVDLFYDFDPLDSTFAIVGLPPQVTIPTPPFGGALGIVPFFPFFTLTSYPWNEYVPLAHIPNDPTLSGVTVLFQSLTGPNFTGSGKDAAWSNVASLTIH